MLSLSGGQNGCRKEAALTASDKRLTGHRSCWVYHLSSKRVGGLIKILILPFPLGFV